MALAIVSETQSFQSLYSDPQKARKTDEELITAYREGDPRAAEVLMKRYQNFVHKRTKAYFIYGGDRDDLNQEGNIGLFKAIRDFDSTKGVKFRGFADLCVTRQIITSVKNASRNKHMPLNLYTSINKPMFDDDSDRTMEETICSSSALNPEQIVISRETSKDLREQIQNNLSELESLVLLAYLDGKSYLEMSDDIKRPPKAIDNALQRIKRKIEKTLILSL